MAGTEDEAPPLPPRIIDARALATTAVLEAERLEQTARRARRRANARLRHYQNLLREHQGEQPLPFDGGREHADHV